MKLKENNRDVITNTNNKHSFRIQANAKMFEILSSRIYTYKIAAIVREISCNAYDAHIEAGKGDVPFRVVLPNDLHPYFEIEDFGVGLSEDQVYDIYTEYGNSTKDDSNDVIGAFGLGSKTPFAYTTSFTIQTRKDGVECLFNAYIGDNGAPAATLLRKRDTSEPNGVKLKVPVKRGQSELFRYECQFILSFFPTRPIVVGNSDFSYDIKEDVVDDIQQGKLAVSHNSHVRSELYRSKRLYAVMGTVCYPISLTDISDIGDSQLKYLEKVVLNGNYDNAAFLRFEIGDLEVNAPREGLSMEDGKPTQAILAKSFKQAIDDLIEDDGRLIDNAEHPNEALSILTEKYGDVLPLVSGQFKYKGKSLDDVLKRKYQSPYNESYYATAVSGWRRSSKISKRHRVIGIDLIQRGYVILNANSPKTRGWQKYTKQVAASHRGKLVVTTDTNWSQHQINRFQQYVGIKASEVITLEDLKQHDRNNKPQHTTTKSRRPPKKVEEVTACSFELTSAKCVYKTQSRHNIDDLRSKGYNVVWTEKHHAIPYGAVSWSVDGRSLSQSTHTFAKYHAFLGDTIIILGNTKNARSITENKVPSLSHQIEWIKHNRAAEIMKLHKQLSLLCTRGGDIQFDHELLELARIVDSPVIDAELYQVVNDAASNIDLIQMYSGTGCGTFSELVDDSIDANAIANEAVKKMKIRYPMMAYVSQYSVEPNNLVDPATARVVEYMKLVERDINQSQYKLTA